MTPGLHAAAARAIVPHVHDVGHNLVKKRYRAVLGLRGACFLAGARGGGTSNNCFASAASAALRASRRLGNNPAQFVLGAVLGEVPHDNLGPRSRRAGEPDRRTARACSLHTAFKLSDQAPLQRIHSPQMPLSKHGKVINAAHKRTEREIF